MIRVENTTDIRATEAVVAAAFGRAAEAVLVSKLRSVRPMISLVCEQDARIVGSIMYTPVAVDGLESSLIMGLAPLAVLPVFQRQGIGSMLVAEGEKACRALNSVGIVVLGSPEYYSKFGFKSTTAFAFTSEFDVPDEVFMGLELVQGVFNSAHGSAKYHQLFSEV